LTVHFPLLRAANEVDRLTKTERARLLRRAAATIKAYRDEIDYSETPANDTGPGDIVFDLNSMASIVEIFPSAKVSAATLRAIEVVKAAGCCRRRSVRFRLGQATTDSIMERCDRVNADTAACGMHRSVFALSVCPASRHCAPRPAIPYG
jgi:hypothetical protein